MIYQSLIVACVVVGIGTLPLASAQTTARSTFKPATFKGLTLGHSTVSEARQKLGEPETTFRDHQGSDWIYYQDIGPAKGRIEMVADETGVIQWITLSQSSLTFAEAQTLFGKGYRIAKYASDYCLADADGVPLFESATGDKEYVVYDSQGIALKLDGVRVKYVEYLSEPLGPKSSVCETTKLNLLLSGRVLNYQGDYRHLLLQLMADYGGYGEEVAVDSQGRFRFKLSHKGGYGLITWLKNSTGKFIVPGLDHLLDSRDIRVDRSTSIDIDLTKSVK